MNKPICLRVNDAAAYIGIGRSKMYEMIDNGEIETVEIGGRRLVTRASLDALLEKQLAAPRKSLSRKKAKAKSPQPTAQITG
jgi:excisionase family DNA binding protein